jgi:hypothetical protein
MKNLGIWVLFSATICSAASLSAAASLRVTTLSSRPEFVSGGDALVEVATTEPVKATVNGRDVSSAFHADATRGWMVGLVAGLQIGKNTLTVKVGKESAQLVLVNHATTGPILSGEHLKPYVCETEASGLGPALDADCSATEKTEFFYRKESGAFKPLANLEAPPSDIAKITTSEGKTVPYVVRVESGTINRAIYRIAMLEGGWNHRVLYSFGGGCGTHYTQGTNAATSVLTDAVLSRGLAHITSTQNVMNQHCNDHLSAEGVMMIKEHFIKRYGVPVWTMGLGGSGGSIQQLLIGQNFPGLLDGLLPSLTFPDSMSVRPGVTDCRLLIKYFEKDAANWTKEKRAAVEGYTAGTCTAWDRSFVDVIVAANAKGCGLPPDQVYDPVKNPKGARCTIWEMNAATMGRDPATGFARMALDNVGVQYGMAAFNAGVISKQEFFDLNRNIGGYDRDGVRQDARTEADLEGVRMSYVAGRIDEGVGGLAAVPILHYRSYNDPLGDIHDRIRDFEVRERLRKANGRVDNQVIWVYPNGNRAVGAKVQGAAIDTMAKWLDALVADKSDAPAIEKVVKAKPATAVDGCWDGDGTRYDEPAAMEGPGKCAQLFPAHRTPRLVAGAPLADDIAKCTLKPVNARDYKVALNESDLGLLREVFPAGVCDYTKPGVNQHPLAGTYLKLPLPAAVKH